MAVVGIKGAGAFGGPSNSTVTDYGRPRDLVCSEDLQMSAIILTSLGSMGVMANLALMAIILVKRPLRR